MSRGILTAIPFILLISYAPKCLRETAHLGRTEFMHILVASQGETIVQDSCHVSQALIENEIAYP
jgi:hypothetical protein